MNSFSFIHWKHRYSYVALVLILIVLHIIELNAGVGQGFGKRCIKNKSSERQMRDFQKKIDDIIHPNHVTIRILGRSILSVHLVRLKKNRMHLQVAMVTKRNTLLCTECSLFHVHCYTKALFFTYKRFKLGWKPLYLNANLYIVFP